MDPGSIPGGCVLQPGGGTQRLRFPEGASCSPGLHTAGLNACVLCVFLCQCLAVMLATFACFWTLPLITSRRLSFIARVVLSLGRSRAIAKHTGFRGFLWVGSSCWEEVTLFHCKSSAFIRSKPR